MRKPIFLVAAGLFFAAAAALVQPPAHAQLDPGYRSLDIFQNGVKVGEVFRGVDPPEPDMDPPDPDIDPPEPDHYLEHWVLSDRYLYPGPRNPRVVTELRPGTSEYKNIKDFLARVPWGKGYRMVRVKCADGAGIPGR